MVTHTAVHQATDQHQAMGKVDLHMARIQVLMARPRQEAHMAVEQVVMGKVKEDTVEGMEDSICIEMEDIVIWRRKPRMILQQTKLKPLKVSEAWRQVRRKILLVNLLRSS